ncbi:hypothetical protein ACJEDY_23370, partial [Escherichia coli]
FCGACGNNRTNRGGFQFAAARLPWFIKQKIESFNFNEALKQQILKDISLCSYEGLHVLKIEIKSVGEVCHFENRYYIRQGTATHLITDGEAISSLHRLYYS